MATISYYNDVLPIGGLNFNPGFEEVLDPTFTLGTAGTGVYEIINNDSGPFQGFKVQFISNVNGSGNFTYALTDTDELKPSGTIAVINLLAPDGTNIAQVMPGAAGFGDVKLENFYARLTNPGQSTTANAISDALNSLFSKNNVIVGSAVADHLKAVGSSYYTEVHAGGGDDVITAFGSYGRLLVGGDGNDVIRVEYGNQQVHGANADGSGGGSQTDVVEIVARGTSDSDVDFYKFSNIDELRFVAIDPPAPPSLEGPSLSAEFHISSTALTSLPTVLAIQGTTMTAPHSRNDIDITVDYYPAATQGVTIDISGWTFSNWDPERGEIEISTNSAQSALADVVIGSTMADEIYTHDGDDTLRGGGGVDGLYGGRGNDTFVYGLNEAADGERVSGGYGPEDGPVDTVLILADNDFTGVEFVGIDQVVFGGAAKAIFGQSLINAMGAGAETKALVAAPTVVGDDGKNTIAFQLEKSVGEVPSIDLSDVVFNAWSDGKDKITITGVDSGDTISGSVKADVINGAAGGDALQGNGGADAFVFDAGFGKGVDHIADFRRKEGDSLQLDDSMFTRLRPGALKKAAFEIGEEADSKKDRVIYDKEDGILRYDDDGSGKHKAKIVAVFDDAATLKAGDIFVI